MGQRRIPGLATQHAHGSRLVHVRHLHHLLYDTSDGRPKCAAPTLATLRSLWPKARWPEFALPALLSSYQSKYQLSAMGFLTEQGLSLLRLLPCVMTIVVHRGDLPYLFAAAPTSWPTDPSDVFSPPNGRAHVASVLSNWRRTG